MFTFMDKLKKDGLMFLDFLFDRSDPARLVIASFLETGLRIAGRYTAGASRPGLILLPRLFFLSKDQTNHIICLAFPNHFT